MKIGKSFSTDFLLFVKMASFRRKTHLGRPSFLQLKCLTLITSLMRAFLIYFWQLFGNQVFNNSQTKLCSHGNSLLYQSFNRNVSSKRTACSTYWRCSFVSFAAIAVCPVRVTERNCRKMRVRASRNHRRI